MKNINIATCLSGIALTFATLFTGGCSQSPDDSFTETGTAGLTIASRSAGDMSRAAVTEDNELINDYWMVWVDADNIVQLISDRPVDKTGPVERETFKVDFLPVGTYTVYAFANITREELATAGGLTFTAGQAAPDVDRAIWNGFNTLPLYAAGEWLPMSGKKTGVVVRPRSSTNFTVEVVRMVAKVQFEFHNLTGEPVTITGLKMGPFNLGDIKLMPDFDPATAPTLVSPAADTTLVSLDGLGLDMSDQGSALTSFYVRESRADVHPTRRFHFNLSVRQKDGTSHDVRYALTDQFQWTNRNDYLIIPVTLIEYILDVDVRFYPPIGGYPAVITRQENSEFWIEFASQGDFEIEPSLRESFTGGPVDAFKVVGIMSVAETGDIFSRAPALDPVTGEITGTLNGTAGHWRVTLEIEARVSPTVTRTITRTIHILSKI